VVIRLQRTCDWVTQPGARGGAPAHTTLTVSSWSATCRHIPGGVIGFARASSLNLAAIGRKRNQPGALVGGVPAADAHRASDSRRKCGYSAPPHAMKVTFRAAAVCVLCFPN
jgi:hypothetical protein